MRVWILISECDEMSPSFAIEGVYSTKQKAEKERETILRENPEMDLSVTIVENVIE